MAQMVANATQANETYADRVAERAEELAPAERRVAERLLEIGPAATLLSAAALAEQLDTSDATVVRTAKSPGYSGLAEMRRARAYGDNPPLGERLRRTLEQTPGDELFARRSTTTCPPSKRSTRRSHPRRSKAQLRSSPTPSESSGEASDRPHSRPTDNS
jgi:hypothetical protein